MKASYYPLLPPVTPLLPPYLRKDEHPAFMHLSFTSHSPPIRLSFASPYLRKDEDPAFLREQGWQQRLEVPHLA